MSKTVSDFSLTQASRILNGTFLHQTETSPLEPIKVDSRPVYDFLDRLHPDVIERLTQVLMHRAIYSGTTNPELKSDIQADNRERVFENINNARSYLQEKLGNALVQSYAAKKVSLFYKLMRYSSLHQILIHKSHMQTLFDAASQRDDIQTYSSLIDFKVEMDKKTINQKSTNPHAYKQLVEESTKQFNKNLVDLLKKKSHESFLKLVDLIDVKGRYIYHPDADPIGFQQVKHYFHTKYPNINPEISNNIFQALSDNFDKLSTKEKTQIINNSLIELFEKDPVTAILSFGRTANLGNDEYNPNLDPHAIPMMKIKIDALADKNPGLDKNLLLGIQDQFEEITKYHLGNQKASGFKQNRFNFKKTDN